MEVMLDGRLITCTPEEYMELKRLGAFGDKPAKKGVAPKLGEGYDEWLKRGMMDMVAVYGCESVLSPNATAGGNLPMLDGKHVYNPDTFTPGTMTCGDCIRMNTARRRGWRRRPHTRTGRGSLPAPPS